MIPIAKPLVGGEELEEVRKVFESGQLAQGEAVKRFEGALAEYHGCEHCITTNSGTSALHAALIALGVGPGDEVIIPDFSFISTAGAVSLAGAKPVFVDVCPDTFNLDVGAAKKEVTEKTKAVMPVSLYGQAYDVDAARELCGDKGLALVSDNCQAIGAEWNGKRNFGDDFAALSFYPTKNLTTAEGGALLTDDAELADKARVACNIGQRAKYEYESVSFNYRLSSVHAAIGLAQLKKLGEWIGARRKNAAFYCDSLNAEAPVVDERAKHVFHQYTVKVAERNNVLNELRAAGVGASVYYPRPLHSLRVFESNADCPVTGKLCESVLSLPVHPALSEEELREVAEAFNAATK